MFHVKNISYVFLLVLIVSVLLHDNTAIFVLKSHTTALEDIKLTGNSC
jgi:hypothetical protein